MNAISAGVSAEQRTAVQGFRATPSLFNRVFFAHVFLLLTAGLAGLSVAHAQADCGACWGNVTQWHGTWNLTLSGSGINNSSQGTFDTSNGVSVVTGTGSISGSAPQCSCSCHGSGALDPSSYVDVVIDSTNCTYSLILVDRLQYTASFPPPIGDINSIEAVSGTTVLPVGMIPEAVLPNFPLPDYGQSLVESATFAAPYPGVGCYAGGGATLTVSWTIEPIVPTGTPRFTHIPTGGQLGCNPTDLPDVGSVLDDTDATAPSGQVSVSADSTDLTNGCTITRSFNLTATDECTQEEAHALVVYSWTEDTEPPVVSGVPANADLGCNPSTKPTDASVAAALSVSDNCGAASPHVSHVDSTNGCLTTRTFTITATDDCGNDSLAKTAVFTWTTDTEKPNVTGVPAGGSLGCNPGSVPTDASVKAQVQANDNCGVAAVNVSHSDSVDGCATTRIFTITATDNCGNASPASTVVYTWTIDNSPPNFTQLPPGGYLGTNPPCIPDDGLIQAETQVSDNCGVASFTTTHADTGTTNLFTRTFYLTATDYCGNENTAEIVYTWSGTATAAGTAPVLEVLNVGTNVLLLWPTNADCFRLISRTSLWSGFWTAVPDAPGIWSNRFVLTNDVTGPSKYYRLAR